MALAVTTSSLPLAQVGVAYSTTLAASGGTAPYTWSILSGSLPAGLSLNASTGVISGTPTAKQGAASIVFTVTDSATPTPATANSSGLTFTVNAGNIVTPGGSAAIKLGNAASLTFPLLPQAWPLTVVPASDPVSAQVPPLNVPQQPDNNNAQQNSVIATAEAQAQEAGSRLV
jgi:hypothetical protein